MSAERIDALRRQIDEIDARLVELLNRRARCAIEIGRLKEAAGEPVYQPAREALVLAHVEACCGGPLDGAAIRRLFERVIDENRRLERQAKAREAGGPGGPAGTVESK